MKNKDIITLVQGGLLAASAHCLPVEHYYKFHRFRRAVTRAWQELIREQNALMAEYGVTAEQVRTDKKNPSVVAFDKANELLLDEEPEMNLQARIPYEFYRGLYDENRGPQGDIFASYFVEELVLDNLFAEPTEEAVEGDSNA